MFLIELRNGNTQDWKIMEGGKARYWRAGEDECFQRAMGQREPNEGLGV